SSKRLQSSRTTASGEQFRSAEPTSKNSDAYCSQSTALNCCSHASSSSSTLVVVGERRYSVSLIIPDAMQIAIAGEGSIPAARNFWATSVQVEPTGSLTNRIGLLVCKEPPRRWWSSTSRISASSAP